MAFGGGLGGGGERDDPGDRRAVDRVHLDHLEDALGERAVTAQRGDRDATGRVERAFWKTIPRPPAVAPAATSGPSTARRTARSGAARSTAAAAASSPSARKRPEMAPSTAARPPQRAIRSAMRAGGAASRSLPRP